MKMASLLIGRQLVAENGGQVVKEWLKFVGVETERFKRF